MTQPSTFSIFLLQQRSDSLFVRTLTIRGVWVSEFRGNCRCETESRTCFGTAPKLRDTVGSQSCNTLFTSCSKLNVVVLDHSISSFRGLSIIKKIYISPKM